MPSDGDEKYAKAAKQSQRDLFGVLALVALVVGAILYVNNTTNAAAGLRMKKDPLTDLTHEVIPMKKEPTMKELVEEVIRTDGIVRKIKETVDIFETNPAAQGAAKELQEATRKVLTKRYGSDAEHRYRVVVQLEFQDTIIDFAENGKDGSFTIELAPSSLQPHSIYTYLEVARHWNGGAFHRIAPHVLQVMVKTHTIKHLAFQEYSPEYPHVERTVGYAGRPSGPAWYVSIQDNSRNHGPGSQQQHNKFEADSCFGRVVEGYEHVLRIRKVQGNGFLGDAKKHVLITSMTIQVARGDGTYETWHDTEL